MGRDHPDTKDLHDTKSLPRPVIGEKQRSSRLRARSIIFHRLRNLLLFLALLALLYLLRVYTSPRSDSGEDILVYLRGLPNPERGPNPPLFYEWHDRERRLPQHNLDLPYPQGREGRYIRFASQGNCALFIPNRATHVFHSPMTGTGAGFGNIMQEIFLNAHLALLSKRMYVLFHARLHFGFITFVFVSHHLVFFVSYTFENYTVDKNPNVKYTNFKGEKVAARVPLTAMIGGTLPLLPPICASFHFQCRTHGG